MNQTKNIVIIGCGAGGGTAAQFARKTDRKAKIIVFEKGKYPQYSKCGLPYTISEIIPKIDDLIEFSEEWFKNANIDLFLETTVEKIDTDNKKIIAKKGNETIESPYDSLIICTGAQPKIPPIKGLENKNPKEIFYVRTINDVEKIFPHLCKNKKATIIGAGLIGLEMADNILRKGMKVTVVETLPNILPNTLDEDMAKNVLNVASEEVTILTNQQVLEIQNENGKISKLIVKNNENGENKTIETDLLVIASGCKPDVTLAKEAGCSIDNTGSIIVNERSETSVKNIYAAGDCTEYIDFVTKKPIPVGLGSIAVRQAIAAGINSCGGTYSLPEGVLQTRTSEFFGIEIAAVGPTINNLSNFSTVSAKFNGSSLPNYYPGGKPILIKLTIDKKTGLILSAQAVGNNAAHRINIFACSMLGKLDIETLRKLETAYAPPIAPTLDVTTLVCDIVSKKMNNKR